MINCDKLFIIMTILLPGITKYCVKYSVSEISILAEYFHGSLNTYNMVLLSMGALVVHFVN